MSNTLAGRSRARPPPRLRSVRAISRRPHQPGTPAGCGHAGHGREAHRLLAGELLRRRRLRRPRKLGHGRAAPHRGVHTGKRSDRLVGRDDRCLPPPPPPPRFAPNRLGSWPVSSRAAHPADNTNSGVRVAVHYGAGDSFASNVLAGGVVGSGNPGTVSVADLSTTVTLPAKTCDYCTLQWIWSASSDGGSYIGCADVAITTNGALPDYGALGSQASGHALPSRPPPRHSLPSRRVSRARRWETCCPASLHQSRARAARLLARAPSLPLPRCRRRRRRRAPTTR